jgi:hypothetical protein
MSLVKSPILTPAKLAANRSNGRLSRGPRTPAGKRRVRLNGLKHGLRSRSFAETVISSARDKERFARGALLLRLAFLPAGAGASRLVERVSRMMWTRGRTARPDGRQPYFLLTPMERALLDQVVRVCAWWYADEAGYRALPPNPRCPLESTDSPDAATLLQMPFPAADPAIRRRAGKRMAKAVLLFARRLAMYEAYRNVLWDQREAKRRSSHLPRLSTPRPRAIGAGARRGYHVWVAG